MQSAELKSIASESEEMVGECIRKEPVGEVDKWKSMDKVWEQLEKGGIAKYIAKLYGYDLEVQTIW